jgi:hypothetical protein
MNKNTVAVVVALITGLAGVTTAVVNRWSPNEPGAEAVYGVTKDAVSEISVDVDELESRIQILEAKLLKINKRKRKKRVPLRKRSSMPDTYQGVRVR